ncbi:hypothetical protein RHSIM_Rhsim06G0124500 [Rhododendron simsii]|uniref:PI3K/PI4K catalytic domain-containing protein n=1 Tax=Rhododendron simsii TaxID=118357 RepID=A0A834GWU1_RHOSS|nr:hypothetical protein RHSIM_Rhsim06G0124500 [Rhododendron simsii]
MDAVEEVGPAPPEPSPASCFLECGSSSKGSLLWFLGRWIQIFRVAEDEGAVVLTFLKTIRVLSKMFYFDSLVISRVGPFTPNASVLEWVNGTLPLGEYLIGSTRNGGAHGRYGKGDWAFPKCREHMTKVGYIVGLGDRHFMNILIDQAIAEVVRIDLGVAFEQGLMLKRPERVPFRLTRDIIDGTGVSGVEGVFIHDPLYKWALSPLKALQHQKETEDVLETSLKDSQEEYKGNKDVARALMRVKQKLDGYEEGEMRSVHRQARLESENSRNQETQVFEYRQSRRRLENVWRRPARTGLGAPVVDERWVARRRGRRRLGRAEKGRRRPE